MSDCAFLNNSGNFTAFTYNGRTIRFRTPSSLERYTDILEWDKGYLVVMAKYKGAPAEEEYIDLVPILNNLYIDADAFCLIDCIGHLVLFSAWCIQGYRVSVEA